MRHFLMMLFLTVIISSLAFAQKDTVNVPDVADYGGKEGALNDAIQQAITAGKLSKTVFKLKPNGFYPLTGAVVTPVGQTLEIVAPAPGTTQQTAPPMIAWTPSGAPDKRYNFDVPGEVIMKNLWILYGSIDGTQTGSTLRVGDSASVSGGRATFDNVIFDYTPCTQNASGAVEIFATHFKGYFKNCYFRNCVDPHFRYYGRALSFRYSSTGLHADSVMFENCTFANMGYVYMQEGAEYADNVHFNHCTFYNIVMFCLESGWWYKMSVTNSLFVNTYMFGKIPINDGEGFGGTINITPVDSFKFTDVTVPFKDPDRHILFANNNYYIEQWLVDWMRDNPYSKDLKKNRRDDEIPLPQPTMNSTTKNFFDSLDVSGKKAFPFINKTETDSINPGFKKPPIAMDSLKSFMWHKWWDNADVNWAYNLNDDLNQVWPMGEDLSYTDATLMKAAMGGFPLGDLFHWWPSQYKLWLAQSAAEKTTLINWLETGNKQGSGVEKLAGVATNYELSQNYPNPFNPTTTINYSIPVKGFVSLKVYNNLGQEVKTLFSGEQNTGNYSVTFDGTGLSSGVYFYQLTSSNVSISKKLVLMK